MQAKFTYVGIRVRDLDKSIEFYTKVLGMKVTGRGKIQKTKGETVGLQSTDDGFTLELNHYESDSQYFTGYVAGEGLDHLGFKVDNLDKALREADALGYRTKLEMKIEDGRWAYIEDPNGIWIELFA
ncbi:MAG: VOC family protein [Candidatus Bathyarchaeia archaeon]|jgi:lactoylglutathione lyase